MTKSPFYITTPIYYVNDSPHIGHAYTTIACDVMARFMRLDGHDVKFLTGTDEHGQKVDKAAKAAGRDPQEFTDEVSKRFRNLVKSGDNLLNVTNDDFIRTTEARHKRACQELWSRMEKNGDIYKAKYGGWYAVRDEAYYQEGELVEKNGKKLAPSGAEVEWVEEESYFFKLSEWQDRLLKFYDDHPNFVVPESRYNEIKSFVKGGLKDLSISRTTFDWGVRVPIVTPLPVGEGGRSAASAGEGSKNIYSKPSPGADAPPSPGGRGEHHVMYVWVDALTNYLTALGFPDENADDYKKFWKEKGDISPVHVVGKDIIRFHAVYWPAFLMSAKLPTPKRIVAHGWWTIEGEKMSKSLCNVISPQDLIDSYGLDQTRYFLMRAIPFGNDGDFSRKQLVETVNADLANNIGNLAQRVLSMINKNCDGKVPEFKMEKEDINSIAEIKNILSINDSGLSDNPGDFKSCMSPDHSTAGILFDSAIHMLCTAASRANIFIDDQAPWKLKKDNPERMKTVLYVLAECIRNIAIMLQPFCPAAAGKLLDQLAVPENERKFEHLTEKYALKPGTPLPAPQGVFPRLEMKEQEEKRA